MNIFNINAKKKKSLRLCSWYPSNFGCMLNSRLAKNIFFFFWKTKCGSGGAGQPATTSLNLGGEKSKNQNEPTPDIFKEKIEKNDFLVNEKFQFLPAALGKTKM